MQNENQSEETITSFGEPDIFAWVSTKKGEARCSDELLRQRVHDVLLESKNIDVVFNDTLDFIEADIVIVDLPKDNWVVLPVSRKPMDWTWVEFITAARDSGMLIVSPSYRESDSIGIFPKDSLSKEI